MGKADRSDGLFSFAFEFVYVLERAQPQADGYACLFFPGPFLTAEYPPVPDLSVWKWGMISDSDGRLCAFLNEGVFDPHDRLIQYHGV